MRALPLPSFPPSLRSLPSLLLGAAALLALHASPARAAERVFVEPDDYGRGAVISEAVPGVTLSVEGYSTDGPEVQTVRPGVGRVSTGVLVLGYFHVRGDNGFTWRDDSVTQAYLIADFDTPTAFVAIDVVRGGGADDTADPGVLEAFDADGNLLDTVRTLGGQADFETLVLARPEADVSRVRITGQHDPVVLDNLRFEVEGELPPPSCEARLQTCEAEVVALGEALAVCEDGASDWADSDGDREPDSRDHCPGTRPYARVDTAGCSLAQFCVVRRNPMVCLRSDWRNDEPLDSPKDCLPGWSWDEGWFCAPR